MREKRKKRRSEGKRKDACANTEVGGKIREVGGRKGIWGKTLRKRESKENEKKGV